jgi:hypothetical protein
MIRIASGDGSDFRLMVWSESALDSRTSVFSWDPEKVLLLCNLLRTSGEDTKEASISRAMTDSVGVESLLIRELTPWASTDAQHIERRIKICNIAVTQLEERRQIEFFRARTNIDRPPDYFQWRLTWPCESLRSPRGRAPL